MHGTALVCGTAGSCQRVLGHTLTRHHMPECGLIGVSLATRPHTFTCCVCLAVCLAVCTVCSCSGRNLTWQTNMGTVDLRATFDKRYEFSVSTSQQHA